MVGHGLWHFADSPGPSCNTHKSVLRTVFTIMPASRTRGAFLLLSMTEKSVTVHRTNLSGARHWINRRPVAMRRHSGGSAHSPSKGSKSFKESLFSLYLARYTALLESRPLATKAVTSGAISFAGDITCQLIAVKPAEEEDLSEAIQHDVGPVAAAPSKDMFFGVELDWSRCARFTLLGAAFVAPALHYWYGFLLRRLPGTAVSTVVKRVSLDQLVFTPFFLVTFLSAIMVFDGNAAKVAPMLRAVYGATLVGNWGYWIPVQIVNFRFVSPVYQVLFTNCGGFFWNIYLSYQSNKGLQETSASGTPPDPQDTS